MSDANLQKVSGNRFNAVDLGKFILAFCVIAGHTNPMVRCHNETAVGIYYIILSYAVPFFFLSSAYLLGRKINAAKDNIYLPLDVYLKKTIRTYIYCSLLYLPLTIAYYIKNDYSVSMMISDYWKGFVFLGEHYNSWQLWYLLSTIYALLFVRILIACKRNLFHVTLMGLCCLPLMLGIDELVSYEGNLPAYLEFLRGLLQRTISTGRLLQGFVMIPLGLFLSTHSLSKRFSAFLFVVGFAFSFMPMQSISMIANTASAVGFFGLALNTQLADSSIYKTLRIMSTDMYVMHMWVWTIYYMLVYQEKTFGLDSFLVTAGVCMLLSYLKQKTINHRKALGKS